jgi:hypothetical protein
MHVRTQRISVPSPNGSSVGEKLTKASKASIDLQRAGEGIRQNLRRGALPSCSGFAFTRKQVTFVRMEGGVVSSASIAVLWSASGDRTVPDLIAPTELVGSILHSLPSAVFIASSDAKDVRADRSRHASGFLIASQSPTVLRPIISHLHGNPVPTKSLTA